MGIKNGGVLVSSAHMHILVTIRVRGDATCSGKNVQGTSSSMFGAFVVKCMEAANDA